MGWMRFDGTVPTRGPGRVVSLCGHSARSGPFYTQRPSMSPNQPTEHPNDRGGPRTYILPHRIHRILDTTAQVADALRGIVRNQEPAAIRVHSVSALVWLFRVRRAFGRYWHPKLPWEGSRKLRYHSHRLYQLVKRCHDSALMRMVKTAPFRDMQTGQSPADETHRCNPALFEDWRYRARNRQRPDIHYRRDQGLRGWHPQAGVHPEERTMGGTRSRARYSPISDHERRR